MPIHNGYTFHDSGYRKWYCTSRAPTGCLASASVLKNQEFIEARGHHNHPPPKLMTSLNSFPVIVGTTTYSYIRETPSTVWAATSGGTARRKKLVVKSRVLKLQGVFICFAGSATSGASDPGRRLPFGFPKYALVIARSLAILFRYADDKIEFIPSNRGKCGVLLLYKTFTYAKYTKTRWYCSKLAAGCKAKIVTTANGNRVEKLLGSHCHPPPNLYRTADGNVVRI
ncbi:hypothetical protein NE865_00939 [Phthorimaea operculella]|nr:hypothetical protein NE865_00939 [Phthorimaea operculella]